MDKLLQQLQEQQSTYSPAQKAVADYIVSHYMDIPFQTISQIAQLTNTSETTISKFCNELGFSGFSGLKHLISSHINASLPLNNRFENNATGLDETSAIDEIMRCDIENIQATLCNASNRAKLQSLLEMIDRAHNVYTIGGRSSSYFASFLAFKLRQQDVCVQNIDFGAGDDIDKMMMIRPGDLVIAFSFPRYTKRVLEILKYVKSKGISIVLITGESLSPAFQYAELVFSCRITSRSYVASYVSCLSLINVILMTRALYHKKDMEADLKELEENLKRFDMFA